MQAAGEELKKDEAVDLVIGNNRKKDLVEVLERYFNEHEGTDDIIDIGKTSEYEKLHIRKIADHTRAFIKVQDGCNPVLQLLYYSIYKRPRKEPSHGGCGAGGGGAGSLRI